MKKLYDLDISSGMLTERKNIYIDKDENLTYRTYKPIKYICKYNQELSDYELILYKKPIMVPEVLKEQVDLPLSENNLYKQKFGSIDNCIVLETNTNKRKWKKRNGILFPKEDMESEANSDSLEKSYQKSLSRSIKTFYDYALNYVWQYFNTYTFEKQELAYNRKWVKKQFYNYANSFKEKNPNMKYLGVLEKHESGTFHIHVLMRDVKIPVVPGIGSNELYETFNEYIYKGKQQNQVFNCLTWKQGHNTILHIPRKDNSRQVINYTSKYITKDPSAGYNEQRFFYSKNLEKRKAIMGFDFDYQINEILYKNELKLYKTDKNGNKYYLMPDKINPKILEERNDYENRLWIESEIRKILKK